MMTERLTLLIDASSKGAAREFDSLSKSAENTNKQVGLIGQSAAGITGAMKGIGAAALGAGVVATLAQMVNMYTEGAKAAGLMATSMNATVGEASQFNSLMGRVGLDANDLIEIQAEFAQAIKGTEDNIGGLGVAVAKNADGTTNWVNTLVDTLDALQGVSDATERNAKLFELFGEEGGKQLSKLVAGGKSVKEMMEEMPELFGGEDVVNAMKFEEALNEVKAAGTAMAVEVGAVLVPMLTTVFDWAGKVAGALGDAFSPQLFAGLLGAGGIIARMGDFGLAKTALGNFGLDVRNAFANFRAGEATAKGSLSSIVSSAKVSGQGLVSALGGPVALGLAATSIALGLIADSAAKVDARVKEAGDQLARLDASQFDWGDKKGAQLLDQAADRIHEENSNLDNAIMDVMGLLDFGAGEYKGSWEQIRDDVKKAREDAYKALGEAGQATLDAQDAMVALADLIAEGGGDHEDYADAVQKAGEQTAAKAAIDEEAAAAMELYKTQTEGAMMAVLDLKLAWLDASITQDEVREKAAQLAFAMAGTGMVSSETKKAMVDYLGSVKEGAQATADAWQAAEEAAGRTVTPTENAMKANEETVNVFKAALAEAPEGSQWADWLSQQITDLEAADPRVPVKAEPTGGREAGATMQAEVQAGAAGAGPVKIEIQHAGATKFKEQIAGIASGRYGPVKIPIEHAGATKFRADVTALALSRWPAAKIEIQHAGATKFRNDVNALASGPWPPAKIEIQHAGATKFREDMRALATANYGTVVIPVKFKATNSAENPEPPGRIVGAPSTYASSGATGGGGNTTINITLPAGIDGREVERTLKRFASRNGAMLR